jgi:hypothetical protein
VDPPVRFLATAEVQMSVVLDQDPWLFVRVAPEQAQVFDTGSDLLVQYIEIEGYPVAFLVLVDEHEGTQTVKRAVLDPLKEQDRQVLEALERSYCAHVALYVGDEYQRTFEVAAFRESVARSILQQVAGMTAEPAVSSAEALKRASEAPPPLSHPDLPFGPPRRGPTGFESLVSAVRRLDDWMKPEKLQEAILVYSVPQHVIDASVKRVLEAALKTGAALTGELLSRAVRYGMAVDEASVVRQQISAFTAQIESSSVDPAAESTRDNCLRLGAAAETYRLELPAPIRRLAGTGGRAPEKAERPEPPAEALSTSDLLEDLKRDEPDPEVAIELCRLRDPAVLAKVFKALVRMEAADVLRVMAHVLPMGENAAELLIAALSSGSAAMRQGSALVLGKLQLRRAITPLVKQLQAEETGMWPEIARALGEFGPSALRRVVVLLRESRGPDQRIVLVLSHLANRGCEKEVEDLEKDLNPRVASATRKATAQRSNVEWDDLAVRGKGVLTDETPAAGLSHIFYSEAATVEQE